MTSRFLSAFAPVLVNIRRNAHKLLIDMLVLQRRPHNFKSKDGIINRSEGDLIIGSILEDIHNSLKVIFRTPSTCRFLKIVCPEPFIVFRGHIILTAGSFFDGLGEADVCSRFVKY